VPVRKKKNISIMQLKSPGSVTT